PENVRRSQLASRSLLVFRPTARKTNGEVAKRSNATDCKSVAPAASEVRILPSPPAFAPPSARGARGEGRAQRRGLRLASQRSSRKDRGRMSVAGLPAGAASKAKRPSRVGGSNSVVESQPSKLLVAGSIPVSRSSLRPAGLARNTERAEAGTTAGKPGWSMGDRPTGRPEAARQRSSEPRRPM